MSVRSLTPSQLRWPEPEQAQMLNQVRPSAVQMAAEDPDLERGDLFCWLGSPQEEPLPGGNRLVVASHVAG